MELSASSKNCKVGANPIILFKTIPQKTALIAFECNWCHKKASFMTTINKFVMVLKLAFIYASPEI